MSTPGEDQPTDPRNSEVAGEAGMPAEFVDTPGNLPGDQQPPPPHDSDDADN